MISCGQDCALSRSEIVRFGFDTFFSIDRYPFQNLHAVAERNEGVLAPSCWRWCCSATSGSKAALKLGLPLHGCQWQYEAPAEHVWRHLKCAIEGAASDIANGLLALFFRSQSRGVRGGAYASKCSNNLSMLVGFLTRTKVAWDTTRANAAPHFRGGGRLLCQCRRFDDNKKLGGCMSNKHGPPAPLAGCGANDWRSHFTIRTRVFRAGLMNDALT